MARYEALQHLMGEFTGQDGERTIITPGTFLSEDDLRAMGHKDIDRLLHPEDYGKIGFPPAIALVRGTEDMVAATPRTLAAAQKDADDAAKARAADEAAKNLGGGILSASDKSDADKAAQEGR